MTQLNFTKNYILEDDFVKLSPLRECHINDLLEISKESSTWTYILEKGNGFENLTKYVQSTINNRKSEKEYPFVVFDKSKEKFVGTTRLYEYLTDLNVIKIGHTWYGEEFRGTGLNKHCKYLLFEFAFETLGVERIGFGAHKDNKISIAAMESIGCKKEGVLRNYIPFSDGKERVDVVLFSILKNEWFEEVKTQLKNKLITKT